MDSSAARESDIPTQDRLPRDRVGKEGKYNTRREPIGISAMALAGLHVKCVLPVTCPRAPPAHGVSVVAPSLWKVVVCWWWCRIAWCRVACVVSMSVGVSCTLHPLYQVSSVADRETIFCVRNFHGCAGSIAIWLWGNFCAPHYH